MNRKSEDRFTGFQALSTVIMTKIFEGLRMTMNFRRLWLLAAFAALSLPGFSQPVPFSFKITWTDPVGVGNPNPSGTCAPYGACYEDESAFRFGGIGVGGIFVMASGALDFAGPACSQSPCTITATGGTGIFSGATGSGTISVDEKVSGGSYTETHSGSIQLTLAGGQGVTISPGSLQLQTASGTTPAVDGLVVNNLEANSISFTAAAGADTGSWLSVSPASGTVAAGSTGALVVTANPARLPLGVYNGQISVTFTGGAQTIPVIFVVGNSGAKLQLSQTGLFLKAVSGGPSPAPGLISVANTGIGTLAGLTATASVTGSVPDWLQVSIAPGFASQTQTTASVSVNPGSLPAGTHFGQVSFALPGAVNSPQTATVQVIVGSALPTFHPSSVFVPVPYDAYSGTFGTLPPPLILTITNPSLLTLDFTMSAPVPDGPLSIWNGWKNLPLFSPIPTSGSIPPGGTSTLSFSVNAGCVTDPTCFSNFPPSLDAWAVTFPALNYTYFLFAEVVAVGPSSAPPIPSWGSPPSLSLSHGFFGVAKPASGGIATASAHACTNSVLEGRITSVPLIGFPTAIGQPTPLEVTAFDNCGNSLDSGSVVATFSTGEPPVSLAPMGGGQWSATWVPSLASNTAVITLQGVSPDGLQGGGTLPAAVASSTTPLVSPGAVLNAASSKPVLAPGSFISIYGVNLASQNTYASSTPFPTLLGSTQAFLGGQPLPLQFSGAKQINAVIPYDVEINAVQQLVVQAGDALSQPEPVLIAAAAPGVFTQDQSGSGPGAILVQPAGSSKSAMNTPANPAKAGDALLIFCTGLGAVTPKVTAGSIAPSSPPAKTDNPVTATIGGIDAPVLFAGLAPGFVALYQVNVKVPSGIAAAQDVPLILSVAGQVSRPVTVAIR